MHRKILVHQPRGRKTHPLVGVKKFYEDERWSLKNHPAHAQKNRTSLVLREYASHDFSAPLRGRTTHPSVGVKDFFENEG